MTHASAPGDTRTVLVTGGAGYVGSHAAKVLRGAGYHTVIFDNLSAGHGEAALGTSLVVGDVSDVAAVRRALRQTRAAMVMHCAGRISAPESVADPGGYYRSNVVGALSTLEAMAYEGCRAFVFSSSAAVYADSAPMPLRETSATDPGNAYGQTKLAIEQALPHFSRAHGLRSVCLRSCNAAGADPDGELGEAHEPECHLIPRAIEAACGGRPLDVFGDDYPTPDGTCLRDYVHVADLAAAHLTAAQHLEGGGGSAIYNVGSGRPSSVREVIATVERVTGKPVPCRRSPRRPCDPAARYASADRIRGDLGWAPERPDLETIVADAWRWHASHPVGFRRA